MILLEGLGFVGVGEQHGMAILGRAHAFDVFLM
jgi:hypothetical protein